MAGGGGGAGRGLERWEPRKSSVRFDAVMAVANRTSGVQRSGGLGGRRGWGLHRPGRQPVLF